MNRDIEFMPKKYPNLRRVPVYESIMKERFERCLDLFLAPRVTRPKINIDPESLIPDLPDPESFRPFPEILQMKFEGHEVPITHIDFINNGEFLASGDSSGIVKIWETQTGKCLETIQLKKRVYWLSWNPVQPLLAICSGKNVFLKSFECSGKVNIEKVEGTENQLAV